MDNPFDTIIEHIRRLEAKVDHLTDNSTNRLKTPASTQDEAPVFLEDAAKFCGMAKQTFYQQKGKIPSHRMPGTKRLIFFKSELIDYIKNKSTASPVPVVKKPLKPVRRKVSNPKVKPLKKG
jgi:predicted DNA-binding transcriptional regulator AlpA